MSENMQLRHGVDSVQYAICASRDTCFDNTVERVGVLMS